MVYHLYGARLDSAWPLPYSRARRPYVAEIALTAGREPHFGPARDEAIRQPQPWAPIVEGLLADGRTYLRWPDRFEFLISANGRQVAGRPLRGGTVEGFHSHLLGQALSFALIAQGLEPLHATVVAVDGGGVAFLGDSGLGKSSLAAAFLRGGHRLLTDDLLVVTGDRDSLRAHAGPPRLKLYPSSARRLMPGATGSRMMRTTPKLLFPLSAAQVAPGPLPLRAMYVLGPARRGSTRIGLRAMTQRQACLALIRNTFNTSVRSPQRLARQLALGAQLAAAVPVRTLTYPRSFALLPAVRDAVLADLDARARQ